MPLPSDPRNLEPNVMGDTDPTGQKILENLSHLAAGYALAKTGSMAAEGLFSKISSMLSEAEGGGSSIETLHKLAGLTPEESNAVKSLPISAEDTEAGRTMRMKWGEATRAQSQTEADTPLFDKTLSYAQNPPASSPINAIKPVSTDLKSLQGEQMREAWANLAKEQSGTSAKMRHAYSYPDIFSLPSAGFALSQANQSQLQSIRDRLNNAK